LRAGKHRNCIHAWCHGTHSRALSTAIAIAIALALTLAQFRGLLKLDGVDLKFTDGALSAIAKLAKEKKTGARGLRAIFEKLLLDPM
jgi:ATP-dependent protease Clp ATPase subunit